MHDLAWVFAEYFDDLHEFNPSVSKWVHISSSFESGPSARSSMGFASVEGGIYLFGGQNNWTGSMVYSQFSY